MMNVEMPSRDAEVIAEAIGELGIKIDRLASAVEKSADQNEGAITRSDVQAVMKASGDMIQELKDRLELVFGPMTQ